MLNSYSFPLTGRGSGVSKDQRLANEDHERFMVRGHEDGDDETAEDWVGTVELAGTVRVPQLSARAARYRVVRRDNSANIGIKVPRNQVVMVDAECLPGIYMARILAALEVCDKQSSFTDARGWNPLFGKSPLVVSPQIFGVASSDGGQVASSDCSKTGMGENQQEQPEGGPLSSATVPGSDLQEARSSLPVENGFVTHVDTKRNYDGSAEETGQMNKVDTHKMNKRTGKSKRECVVGFVPIQIVNLSLEEVELHKHTYVGLASPTQNNEIDNPDEREVNVVQRGVSGLNDRRRKFDVYLRVKLAHLKGRGRRILLSVLRRYCHLFYRIGSTDIGCTSQVHRQGMPDP